MSTCTRVLITGGTGLVGRRLAASLLASGTEVVLLSRDADAARAKVPGADAHAWAPEEGPPPAEAFAGVDGVVNLAGEPVDGRWTAVKKGRIRESRVAGTANLVTAIQRLPEEARPRVLVTASAIGYYGDTGDDAKGEDASPADEFLSEVCAAWEAAAKGAEALGVRVVALRIGLVLDPHGGALGKMLPLWKAGLGGPMGGGRQWVAWIHRDDLTDLIRFALESDVAGTLNATSPNPVRQAEFAKTLGAAVNRPAFLPAPGFALKVALGEFSVEVLGSRRVVPNRTLSAGFTFAFPTLEGALADLLSSGSE